MPSYFSMGTKSSEQVSQRYLQINNCGFCEALEKTNIARPNGRKDYQLIYIKSGAMEFEEDGQKQHLSGGHVIFFRPGVPQHYRINGVPTTFFWIHFTGSAVGEMLAPLPDGCIHTGELPLFERFCKAFYADHRLTGKHTPLHYEGELICLFAAILQCCHSATQQRQPSRKIDPALLAISRSISPRLSNEQLAQLCKLNKHYFIKLFKCTTGMTPQQYYTTAMVDKARSLLEDTDYAVSKISAMCGVEDCFYFSRLFKKHTGMSPAAYRKHRQL